MSKIDQHDHNRITEDGAEAVALALAHRHRAWRIIRRMQRGGRADWLLEDAGGGTVALEVMPRASSSSARQLASVTSVFNVSVSTLIAPDGTESCGGTLETHYAGASLVNVCVLANLFQLLGKPCRYAAPVDSTLPTSPAWKEVSAIEEELAKAFPVSEGQGRIARRGAVSAALKAGDYDRAQALAAAYIAEGAAPTSLKIALRQILEEADQAMKQRFQHAAKYHTLREARDLACRQRQDGPFGLAAKAA